MATITLTCSNEQIKEMKKFYSNSLLETPNYSIFAANYHDTRITAYQSGKVVFQGRQPEIEANRWGKQLQSNSHSSNLPPNFENLNIIGSDETGNGSYFGPLTVCATYVNQHHVPTLKKLGVKDSKQLTDAKMRAIVPTLKQILPYKLLIVTPKKYNQVQPKYNAVHMKAVLHNRVLALLEKEVNEPIDGILIDQFTSEKNYKKYIQNESPKPKSPTYFAIKGEEHHLAVAAASIIARVAFLDELEKEGQSIGYDMLPSGAGQNVDHIAGDIINRYGKEMLKNVAKWHFANTKKAIELAKKNRLRG